MNTPTFNSQTGQFFGCNSWRDFILAFNMEKSYENLQKEGKLNNLGLDEQGLACLERRTNG